MSALARKIFRRKKSVFNKPNIVIEDLDDADVTVYEGSTPFSKYGLDYDRGTNIPEIVLQSEHTLAQFDEVIRNYRDRMAETTPASYQILPYGGENQVVPYKSLASQRVELRRSIQTVRYRSGSCDQVVPYKRQIVPYRTSSSMELVPYKSPISMQVVPYRREESMQIIPYRFDERFPALSDALGIGRNRRECERYEKSSTPN